MTDYAQPEPLPGLEPPARAETSLKKATRRTIVALQSAGYLDETHAMPCELMLKLADVIEVSVRSGKASAAAMAAAQIHHVYEQMRPELGGGDDEWSDFVAELRRSSAAVRDQAQPGAAE
ncbi:MAG TPA: hypothetical protein VN088_16350 [Nocardioides sp.]|nr:hypothetical protein [Nocardioides sp.]